jgi:hypothetical protein
VASPGDRRRRVRHVVEVNILLVADHTVPDIISGTPNETPRRKVLAKMS